MEPYQIIQSVILIAIALWGGWYAHRQRRQREKSRGIDSPPADAGLGSVWEEKKARMLKAIAAEMGVTEEEAEYMAVSRMHVEFFPGHDGNQGGAEGSEILSSEDDARTT